MILGSQVQLNQQIPGRSVSTPSSPAIVAFNGGFYLFYVGAGNNLQYSVWTATGGAEGTGGWSTISTLGSDKGILVAGGTSPTCAVFDDQLYVFYNGIGNNGVFYTTFDGTTWTVAEGVPNTGFLPSTSPRTAVYEGTLYVFWNGSADDGIWFSTFADGAWSAQTSLSKLVVGLGIATGTGPAACVFDEELYVFYNGVGNDGTFYASYNGSSWSNVASVSESIGGMAFAVGTSPAAAVIQGGAALALVWSGSAADGIWLTTLDSTGWQSPQQHLVCTNGAPGVLPRTSPALTMFDGLPMLCWNGSGNDGIWLTSQLSFTLSASSFAPIVDAMYNGYNFQILVIDQATVSSFQNLAPNLLGQVQLNDNTTQSPADPNVNPALPGSFFGGLTQGQITFLLTLVLALIAFAIARYNRMVLVVLGNVLRIEFANNNNNQPPQPPNAIPLLPIQNANDEL
jgi:hypothetical protein